MLVDLRAQIRALARALGQLLLQLFALRHEPIALLVQGLDLLAETRRLGAVTLRSAGKLLIQAANPPVVFGKALLAGGQRHAGLVELALQSFALCQRRIACSVERRQLLRQLLLCRLLPLQALLQLAFARDLMFDSLERGGSLGAGAGKGCIDLAEARFDLQLLGPQAGKLGLVRRAQRALLGLALLLE